MTFRWLPDADQYAHPRLTWSVMLGFDLVLGHLFRIEHDLPEGFRLAPGSMVVSNHLRDSDAPLLGKLVFNRRGVHMRGPLLFFVMREDLYQPEALANLLYACPWPWIRLLRLVRLGWLFRNVRTFPLRRLREFTWHDTLRELSRAGMGSLDPARVFNARGLRELRQHLGGRLPARLSDLDPWRLGRMRVAYWGLRRLRLDILRRLAPAFRDVVDAQLRLFARVLDAGHHVYFAPEGRISSDGRFGRIRAGTWRLPALATNPVPVMPFALSYDPLGPGRARVLVRMGPPLRDLDPQDRRRFTAAVKASIVGLRVVTVSHLLAGFLCGREVTFDTADLIEWLQGGMRAVRDAGVSLDPLLERQSLPLLARERLRWLGSKRFVTCRDGVWTSCCPADTAPTWLSKKGTVRFLANALADLVPAFDARRVACT